jgi:hexosaminidase
MLERMTGGNDISSLKSLADLVEPVKGYAREGLAATEATSMTPMNRLIDAARPERIPARRFAALVDEFVSGQNRPGLEFQIRSTLASWRDNDVRLRPIAQQSSFVQEVMPLSQALSSLSTAGLEALDYMDRGEKAPADWEKQQLQVVEQAYQPKAQVLLMVAPAVQKLVQKSAGEQATELPLPKNAND